MKKIPNIRNVYYKEELMMLKNKTNFGYRLDLNISLTQCYVINNLNANFR